MEKERAKVALGDDVLHEVGRERHAEAAAAREPPQHVIVGKVIGYRVEAAYGAEGVPPAGDGRAESVAEPLDAGADEGGGQEPLINEHNIELRGDAATGDAGVEAGDQPDRSLFERRHHRPDICGVDTHVGVGEDEGVVPRLPDEVGEVAHLPIRADRALVDN